MSDLAQKRQLQRLKYIDLCAYILGFVNRKFLMNRFDVKQAWATKDFNTYQKDSNNSLVYDHGLKAYKPVESFNPIFEHDINEAINLVCEGKQSLVCEPKFANNSYSYSIRSVEPVLTNIYSVLRALYLNKKVEMQYVSRSSGKSHRLIVPHSLIKTGCFTYVRAFDHQAGDFRTFKLNRIIRSKVIDTSPANSEMKGADADWHHELTLVIMANGNQNNREAIEFDFGLVDGKLEVTVKKALIMYFLMDWNIAPKEYADLPSILFPLRVESIND